MYRKYFKGTHVGKGPISGFKFGTNWWLNTDENPVSRDSASVGDI